MGAQGRLTIASYRQPMTTVSNNNNNNISLMILISTFSTTN